MPDFRLWHLADMRQCVAMSAFGGKADITLRPQALKISSPVDLDFGL